MNHISTAKFMASMLIFAAATFSGCSPSQENLLSEADGPEEIGSQLGDVMASIDEAGKGSTTIASYAPTFDRYNMSSPKQVAFENAFKFLLPDAVAATCGLAEFGSCSNNTVLRNFNGCTIGSYTLSGYVQMTWSGGTNCSLNALNQTIRVTPNYVVGKNNMSLTTVNTGTYGVTLTLTSAASAPTKTWNYTNDGISRTLRYNGTTLLSIATRTNSAIAVTGSVRGNRSISSGAGALEVTSSTGESCTFQANTLSWGAANCNCATTGSWSGTCSTLGAFTMTMNGCGLANLSYTENGSPKTKAISLDRCVQN